MLILVIYQKQDNLWAANNAEEGYGLEDQAPSAQDIIDTMIMATLGNAIDFGNLASTQGATTSCSSPTRVATGGGASTLVTIQYQDIATGSDAVDFGDLHPGRQFLGACFNGHGGL